MNKNLLAIAVGALFVVPGAAMADVKVYGKFNIGVESQKDEIGLDGDDGKAGNDHREWLFKDQTNSSRLGFKGDQDVGLGDLKVIYQLEYGIDPDGSEGSPFSERNTFVGLQGGFGTMKFGFFDTPVKVAGEKADFFNDESLGDDKYLLVGETRQKNMIQYSTPKLFDALSVNLAINPGEDRVAVDDAADTDHGIADTFYASVAYETKMVYASLSYANHEAGSMKFDGSTVGYDIIRGAVYVAPITDLELAALYQQAQGVDQDNAVNSDGSPNTALRNASDAKEKTWMLSAAYSISALKLKARYGQTDGDQTDFKRTSLAVGADYKLSKALVSQLYYIRYEDKDRTVGGIKDPQTDAYGLGLVYTF